MDFYEQEQTEDLLQRKEKYKKLSRRPRTLIFEMVDTMLKILDPAVDEFSLTDTSISQVCVEHGEFREVIFVKLFATPLVKVLKLLQQHYEVIVFTIIPTRFLNKIISLIPNFSTVVNFVLPLEEAIQQKDYVVKDISFFLQNRTLESIYVIDTCQEAVDSDCLQSLHPEVYDGSILYKQLSVVVDGLRIERNATKT